MLSLDSDRWTELQQAYGNASNIPTLLSELSDYPTSEGYEAEPYFSLWSSLCHQGTTYTASYAALPHIIKFLEDNPARANFNFFLLPCAIEISRQQGEGPIIPHDLVDSYFEALAKIPHIAASISDHEWDINRCQLILATIAAAKGHADLAESILQIEERF